MILKILLNTLSSQSSRFSPAALTVELGRFIGDSSFEGFIGDDDMPFRFELSVLRPRCVIRILESPLTVLTPSRAEGFSDGGDADEGPGLSILSTLALCSLAGLDSGS